MAKVTSFKNHAQKLTAFILVFILFISGISLVSSDAKAAGGFYVSGTTICDANGNAFVMRGVNVPHAWFTSQTETSLKAIASLGANTVRVVCSNGMQYNKTSYSELSNIINLCKKNKLICVLEVHDATGSDSTSDLNAAVNYWIEMKNVLRGNEAYVILNIANEWYGSWDGAKWASGNINAIRSIRNAGISNMIMIDSAGWGQYPDSIKNYGKSVFNADSQKNTVFSIHMYEYAGGNASTVRTNIDNALSIGVPVVIGEFGGYHTGGDVDELTIMSYCQQKGVGYLAWSWKGNGSGLEYLDLANNWNGSSLTSFGNTVFNNTNGIKKTSKICSVFDSNSGSNSGSSNSGSSSSGSVSSGSLDGVYYIRSANSGKYLDIASNSSANGANLIQYQFTGGNNQKFKLVSDGNGYYYIRTGSSGYNSCIDVSGRSASNGTNIAQWSYNGGTNQKFQIVKVGDKYAIKTVVSNNQSCLDVEGRSASNNANILQWQYSGSNNQLWYLEKIG